MRIALTGVVALVASIPALATAQVVTLGAHGGVNVASAEGTTSDIRPVAGASLEIGISPPLAIRVEAEYSETGAHVDASAGGGMSPMAFDYHLGYLAVPINLRYDVTTGTVPIYLFAGTTLGALLFATQKQDGASTDVKDQLRPIDVSLDLGGGLGYRISPSLAVSCDVRWSFGLLDGVKDDAVLAVDSWKTRNVKIVLGVTYTFNPLAPATPSMPMMPGMGGF